MPNQYINLKPKVVVRHVGDIQIPLGVQLFPGKSNTPIDLTGLTVEFYMVNSSGTAVVAQSATGVTVTDAVNGKVQKVFLADDVDTAGEYYGYFVVLDGSSQEDTFPVDERRLVIQLHGD